MSEPARTRPEAADPEQAAAELDRREALATARRLGIAAGAVFVLLQPGRADAQFCSSADVDPPCSGPSDDV